MTLGYHNFGMNEFANTFFVAPPDAECIFVASEGACRVPGSVEDGDVDLWQVV